MKLVAQMPNDHRRFIIEHDESVGCYLYVFEDDRCVYDYLQDTCELAIEQAFAEFNVPISAWSAG